MTGADKQDRLAGKLVLLVGGGGFFGTHAAQALLARGARVRVASRHPERAFRIKPLGNLGQVQFARCDMTRPETLARVVAGVDAVVNLVGAFDGNLDAVQGSGAGRLAEAARAAGAGAFVHISAIGADAGGATGYARSKAAGEAAVLAAFPSATVLRPSVLFGPDDRFINLFGGLIAALPVIPVFAPEARFQPLFVDDAAEAVANALADPAAHGGKIFELGGPEAIAVGELNRRIAAAQGRKVLFAELPDAISAAFAALTGWLPGAPLSRQQWLLLKAGNTTSGNLPGIAALGVQPRPLGLFLDRWMVRYRKHGRFGAKSAA
jgi:NADH dehydrogenase